MHQLTIRNMAVVKDMVLEFDSGLTVITGESGVGKSIIVDAISLLCGGAASDDMIRANESMAFVEGIFDRHAIPGDWSRFGDDAQLIIQRSIKKKGGQATINGMAVTLKELREYGRAWVSMVGQHDQLALFEPATQLAILDQFEPHLVTHLQQYRELFNTYTDIHRALADLQRQSDDDDQQLAFLTHQLQELNDIAPLEDEDITLQDQKRALGIKIQTKSMIGDVMSQVSQVMASMESVQRALQKCPFETPALDGVISTLDTIATQLWHESTAVQSISDRDMDQIETRLDELFKAKSKYKVLTTMALVEKWKSIQSRYDALTNRDHHRGDLQTRLAQVETELREAAQTIRELRHQVGATMSQSVTNLLHQLGLRHALFSCEWQSISPQSTGMDRLEWVLTVNAGESPKPIRKAASGGELSRVLLAIHTVLVSHHPMPVLVFDEIDTGVGGMSAIPIGELLTQLSKQANVICVTHLAQIAQFATHHIRLEKWVEGGVTITQATRLSPKDRQGELKRMVGGDAILSKLMV